MGKKTNNLNMPTTVYDHIRELRTRLFVSIMALGAAGTVIYLFYGQVLALLSSPLGAPLYYSNPAGSFSFVMKICLTGALIVTIPVLAYNIIMFIRPAFIEYLPKKRVVKTTLGSTVLAISGAAFAFLCILPGTLSFFKGFQVDGLKAMISADNYLNFVTNIIIMFVIVFQIPLIITFIDRIKPIKPIKLFKMEKWVILGSLIIALIAPFTYDLLTSLLIALPVVALYNLSIVIVLHGHAVKRRKSHKEFCARIAKPVTESASSKNSLSFENLADEIINLEQTSQPVDTTSSKPVMDIMPTIAQTKVQPADWVIQRKIERAKLNQRVSVFSDIQKPRVNSTCA